ncbi:MAG: hypothetical protein ACI921_001760, partial [Polaribacter sp.]
KIASFYNKVNFNKIHLIRDSKHGFLFFKNRPKRKIHLIIRWILK